MLTNETNPTRAGQANNTAADREGRAKAFRFYRFLAVIQFLLGVALIFGGYKGTQHAGEVFGPPFYIGGFIVGPLMLLSALIGFCIVCKGFDESNEIRRNEVKGCVSCHHVTAAFVFMGCLPSLMFTAMNFGCSFDDDCSSERDHIRYAIIAGIVVAILTGIFSMFIVCTYGKYFGFIITSGRRRMIVTLDDHHLAGGPMYGSDLAHATQMGLGGSQNSPRMQQLARENELLQQQLELQKQIGQQQPLNTGVGYPPPPPPPPPPATYGFSIEPPLSSFHTAPDPLVAPPAYSSIKGPK